MKTLRNTLIFVAILVALILWLNSMPTQVEPDKDEAPPKPAAAAPIASAPNPAVAAPPAAPAQPAPQARPQRSAASAYPAMKSAADAAGVKIIRFTDNGMEAVVALEWASDQATAGSEYLENLRRTGKIGRSEPVGQPLHARIADGRRVYGATYKVLF